MIPIPGRTASRVSLIAVLILAVGGCGLSEEIDREVNPDRAVPSEPGLSASSAGTDPPGGVHADELPEFSPSDLEVWPTEAPTAEPTGACPASGVRMVPGLVEAAMGLRAMSVTLTNCGTKPYTLNGYPSLQVLDADGERLDIRVLKGAGDITTGVPDAGPHTVTVRPGKSARTSLVWRNTVTEADTPSVNAPSLRIAPAEGEPAEVVTPEGGIDLGNTGRIGATAWSKVVEGS